MFRRIGAAWLAIGVALGVAAGAIDRLAPSWPVVYGVPTTERLVAVLSAAAVTAATFGLYVGAPVRGRPRADEAPQARRPERPL